MFKSLALICLTTFAVHAMPATTVIDSTRDSSVTLTAGEARMALALIVERNYCVQDLSSARTLLGLKDSIITVKTQMYQEEHAKFLEQKKSTDDCLTTAIPSQSTWQKIKANLEVFGIGVGTGAIAVLGALAIFASVGN